MLFSMNEYDDWSQLVAYIFSKKTTYTDTHAHKIASTITFHGISDHQKICLQMQVQQ